MDLNFSDQERAFQSEVQTFLAENLPDDIAAKVRLGDGLTKDMMDLWHSILNAKGWLATTWPKAFGGPGWTPVQKHIFEEECCRAYAPRIVPFGLNMLGPVLQKFGTAEQQESILPRILSGEDWWCQGYSEPGAGSDLASLKTRAIREATRTSSMVRKHGPHWASTQIRFSALCAQAARANPKRASALFWSTLTLPASRCVRSV